MNSGTEPTSQVKQETASHLIDDTKHTVNTFQDLISQATLNGDEWVETSPEIIRHYNRNGLGKTADGVAIRFFIYNGIKVCPFGEQESIEAEMNRSVNSKVHGPSETVQLGPTR